MDDYQLDIPSSLAKICDVSAHFAQVQLAHSNDDLMPQRHDCFPDSLAHLHVCICRCFHVDRPSVGLGFIGRVGGRGA